MLWKLHQCSPYIETSQLICSTNQLTGFYMRETLVRPLSRFWDIVKSTYTLFLIHRGITVFTNKHPTKIVVRIWKLPKRNNIEGLFGVWIDFESILGYPLSVRLCVCNAVFSGLVLYFFQIFWMKLGNNKDRKAAEPFFEKKCYCLKSDEWGILGLKSNTS